MPVNQAIDLTRIGLNIHSVEAVKMIVIVSDEKSLHLSQQWNAPASTI
ncbi:hypothetical protein IV511_10600 [Enterobacter quasihormaechei]